MPSVAKCAVNSSNVSSDAGDIDLLAILQNLRYLFNPALYTFRVEGDASAMLLNAAAATILTALLILTLRSYTYITQQ